jgi:hypothetical protein
MGLTPIDGPIIRTSLAPRADKWIRFSARDEALFAAFVPEELSGEEDLVDRRMLHVFAAHVTMMRWTLT